MLLASYNLQQHSQLDDYDGRDFTGFCRYTNSILRPWPANPRYPSCKLYRGLDRAIVELIAVSRQSVYLFQRGRMWWAMRRAIRGS